MGVNWRDGKKVPYSKSRWWATHPNGWKKERGRLLGQKGTDVWKTFDRLFDKFTKGSRNNWHDTSRLWSLILNCEQVLHEGIEGDLAEVGVYRGNSAAILAEFAKFAGRRMYLFDTFCGFDSRDPDKADDTNKENKPRPNEHGPLKQFKNTSIDMVKEVLGDSSGVCSFVKGHFPETFTAEHKSKSYSIVSIDCDLYKPTVACFNNFYPLLSKGGILFVHDYGDGFWKGVAKATDEFCNKSGEHLILMPDGGGSAFIRKARG